METRQTEQLQQIFQDYSDAVEKARREAAPLAGIFGMRGGVKDDPCHMAFYNAVGAWVADFAAAQPEEAAVAEAARYLLTAAAHRKGSATYWTCLAAQGHAKALLTQLPAAHCDALRQEYDRLYPKADRLPINDEIYTLLCRRSGAAPQKNRWLRLFGK